MVRTNFSRAVGLNHTLKGQAPRMHKAQPLIKMPRIRRRIPLRCKGKVAGAGMPGPTTVASNAGLLPDESVTSIYSAAGGNIADDDRRAADRHCGVPATAGFSVAGGGLSNYSGDDVLSWRRSNGDGVLGNRAPGTPVRTSPRTKSDDLDQFARGLGYNSAVQS